MNERKPIVVRIMVITILLLIGLGICFAKPLVVGGTLSESSTSVELDNVTPTEPETTVVETEPPTEPETEPVETKPEPIIESAAAREALADPTFLAKLIWCEGGTMSWEGQVYICSAILNLSDTYEMSIWKMGHRVNMFSVAPWVDSATPTQFQYDVIDYVINQGGRIPEVRYFQMGCYHSFGTPVHKVDGCYFSK
jgi:hypothetical protein